MSYSSDEMSDGAKLAVAGGLLAAGGFVAWLIGKPSTKTASGSGDTLAPNIHSALKINHGATGTLVSHANLGVAPTYDPNLGVITPQQQAQIDYAAGYAFGVKVATEQKELQAKYGQNAPFPGGIEGSGRSQAWQNGYAAGYKATISQ